MSANTCLYISNTVVVAFAWETVLKIVGLMGQPSSLSTAYKFAALGPNFPLYIQGVFKFLPILIADVLMVGGSINIEIMSRPFCVYKKIWRCYKIWEDSLRIILTPLILVIVEIGKCIL